MNRPSWLFSAACLIASYALITRAHFTFGELALDDAATFFVAIRPLRELLTLPASSQGQPPLFFAALHAWMRFGDTEGILRLLPLTFMACAAATLLSATWLTPATRVVSLAILLLSTFSQYLTPTIRPYSLAVWLSLWSCLAFARLLREPRRGVMPYVWYVVATLLLVYSLTLAVWTLVAQGLCALAATGRAAAASGLPRAIDRYRGVLVSLAIVAVLYLPHAVAFLRFQAVLERSPLWMPLLAALNPRHYLSGPFYLLALPGALGWAALALAAVGIWTGARDRDPLVGLLVTVVIVQIGATQASMAGRYGFSFRYLTPAFPALCLLVGLGADRALSRLRHASLVVAVCAAAVLATAAVAFARAPGRVPDLAWRQVAAEFRQLPGRKLVLFDVGWEAQSLRYEARQDPDVQVRNDAGPGWFTFGRVLTPEYVARVVERETAPGMRWFYYVDDAQGSRNFDDVFVPAMTRHQCARVSQRVVPTYAVDGLGDTGATLYGYLCR